VTFFQELKRRNVVKIAVLYLVGSWLILQIADVLFPNLGAPAWAFALVLGLLIIFFVPALVIAWVYELTPDGLKKEKDIARNESITPATGRKINALIVVLLVLAIAAVVADRLVPESAVIEADELPSLSIAVLPFADMSPQKDQEYFTDGISEELLNLLARVPDFRVAGRTSSFAFKGKNQDLREIGEQLNVSTVLEGSVRKDGDRIRVTAQLVKTGDGFHMWSDTYDRKLENIFALQDDIARQVVAALKDTLLADGGAAETDAVIERGRPTDSKEAYSSYLRGRHLMTLGTYDAIVQARDEFDSAIELDPAFAEAYASLANVYGMLVEDGFRSNEDVGPEMMAALDDALRLDPDSSEGLTVKATMMFMDGDADDTEIVATLEQAVASNPNNADAMVLLSRMYWYLDREDESEQMMQRAYDVDPLSPMVISRIVLNLMEKQDREGAGRYLSELASIAPGSARLYRTRSRVALYESDFVEATRWLHEAVLANDRDLMSRLDLAGNLQRVGALDAVEVHIRKALELNPDSPRILARLVDVMQYRGQREQALELIERRLEQYPTDIFLRSYRSTVLFHMERFDEARAQIEDLAPGLLDEDPKFESGAAFFYGPRLTWLLRRDGDPSQAQAIYDTLVARIQRAGSMTPLGGRNLVMARWEAGMGNRDAMLAQLETIAETSTGAWELFRDPMFYEHAGDPDYDALVARFEAVWADRREALREAGVL